MIVKVCGMREAKNIQELDHINGLDWIGFIFYPPSPRYVKAVPCYLPQEKKRVGVFVNESPSIIAKHVEDFGLQMIQLHGNETPDFCQQLRNILGTEIKLIKMIAIATEEDLEKSQMYEHCVDYLLFETKFSGYGGSGKVFDWNILHHYQGKKPFLITGGIQPSDVEKVQAYSHPMFVGIDLNSGFEIAPGLKDSNTIKDFIQKLNN